MMDRRDFLKWLAGWASLMTVSPSIVAGFASGNGLSGHWRPLPLTTEKMREMGILGGDGFQYVHSIVYAPSDPSVVYLSVDQSGVWRSKDGGKNWRPQFKGFWSYGARSIAVDPLNPDVVLAAGFLGFDRDGAAPYPNRYQGIYLTRDGGDSWRMVFQTDFFKQVSKGSLFVFDPSSGASLSPNYCKRAWCASASDGLLESIDGGESWRAVSFNEGVIHDMAWAGDGRGTILMATTRGLYRYRSGKAEKIGRGLTSFPRSIATSLSKPGMIYTALGLQGVFRSMDYGERFEPHKIFLFPPLDATDIAVSPVDAKQLYIRANQSPMPPYFSHDGGETWSRPESVDPDKLLGGIPGFWFSSPFAPHPTEARTCLHVTNGRARIIRTEDGGKNWRFSGSGFMGARMSDIIFLSSDHMIFGLTDHGLYETKDRGETFIELDTPRISGGKNVSSGSAGDRSMGAASGETLVVGFGPYGKKGLLISRDGGSSFTEAPNVRDIFSFIAFHPEEKGLVYAGSFKSSDYGRRWVRMPETISAISPDGKTIYALKKKNEKQSEILASKNRGERFIPVVKLEMPDHAVTQMVVTPSGTLYLSSTRGVYRIEGGRVELRDERHGLSRDFFGTMYTECIAYDPNHPERIFVGRRALGHGNGNGLFFSRDGGESWENANFNLSPGRTIFSIKINPFDSSVYVGTSFGTYRLEELSLE